MPVTPVIPEFITVHLGTPDQEAENVTVSFPDYIKNVASSEIYPTWPDSALRANILAQISFALNRVYTEWYRSRGYDFDITNSTAYDQKFINNRDYFENISKIVDQIFNNYVVKQGSVVPYFTQYCNGTTVTCAGLSQWGTVDLAEQGLLPYQILRYYYGDDTDIVLDAPVQEIVQSYPGVALSLGIISENVRTIQRQLNRISDDYPAIPKIPTTDGVFNLETQNAVRAFQEIFNLTVDGIVGKATWYKIKFIFNSVKNLAELQSEGLTLEEVLPIYQDEYSFGDEGLEVRTIQYYLAIIGFFNPALPPITITGVFDENTRDAVFAFQNQYGLPVTGVINRDTWNELMRVYQATVSSIPQDYVRYSDRIFPGRSLTLGSTGEEVQTLQRLLQLASNRDPSIPRVDITGTFDNATDNAVRIIQTRVGLPVNGTVGPIVWNSIVNTALGN